MPRLAKKLPAYRFHKPSGQALVCIDGHRTYLGKFDSPESREAYNRLIGEWVAGGRQRTAATAAAKSDDGLTVAELIAAFWEHAREHYRKPDGTPSREPDNFRWCLRHLRRLYGRTPAADFGPKALKAVRAAMLKPYDVTDDATGKAKTLPGGCRTYVNRQVARLKQVFKWATAEELVPASVYHGLSAVGGLARGRGDAKESAPVGPAPLPYVEAALPFLSRQLAAMVRLQLVTGMRPGEACLMRGVDVDTTGKLWLYRPSEHKTEHHGHARTVLLGPQAQEIVRPFLKPDVNAYLFCPAEAEAERRAKAGEARKTPLSCGNTPGSNRKAKAKREPGERYRVDSYAHAVARACDKADRWAKAGRVIDDAERLVPRWHPHQLRHNAATRLRKEYGIEAARIILGHKSAAITEVYAERDVAAAEKIMGEVG